MISTSKTKGNKAKPGILAAFAIGLVAVTVSVAQASNDNSKDLLKDNEGGYQSSPSLEYGEVLYHYHQGLSFDGLVLLSANLNEEGKAQHQYAELIRGAMYMALGMTRSAKDIFETLLSDHDNSKASLLDGSLEKERVQDVENKAWFYLGKIFYLEADYGAASAALAKVDRTYLSEEQTELSGEYAYLEKQIRMLDSSDGENEEVSKNFLETELAQEFSLEGGLLWPVYPALNQAILAQQSDINAGLISARLASIYQALLKVKSTANNEVELLALRDRVSIALGSSLMRAGQFDQATETLSRVRLNSPLIAEALFHYSVALTHVEKFDLAASVLARLNTLPGFRKEQQQIPFAVAYLAEQQGALNKAKQAYANASVVYESSITELDGFIASLNEEQLLNTLVLDDFSDTDLAFSSQDNSSDSEANSAAKSGLSGETLALLDIDNDAYGRLKVHPKNTRLADVFAQEAFQFLLRDLKELYQLRQQSEAWRDQLDNFDVILAERAKVREQKLAAIAARLEQLNAAAWTAQAKHFDGAINTASDEQNALFFMSPEQAEFAERLASVEENLQVLKGQQDLISDDEWRVAKQNHARMKAYFVWWIEDKYAANRWKAQKQLIALNKVMLEFSERIERLEQERAKVEFQSELIQRVEQSKARLESLLEENERTLAVLRQNLVEQARTALRAQRESAQEYLVATRHAYARLSDQLYRDATKILEPVNEATESTEASTELTDESNVVKGEASAAEGEVR